MAIPVIAVTSIATLVYVLATILPAIDRFCPYSTPVIAIFVDTVAFLVAVTRAMRLFRWPRASKKTASEIARCVGSAVNTIEQVVSRAYNAIVDVPRYELPPGIELDPRRVAEWKIFKKARGGCGVLACVLSLILFMAGILLPYIILHLVVWLLWRMLAIVLRLHVEVLLVLVIILIGVTLELMFMLALAVLQLVQSCFGLCTRAVKAITLHYELSGVYSSSTKVPMDLTTSQMLAWLIANCEDSRSVDTALQAMAGANENLPIEPLAECRALELVLSRLDTCVKLSDTSPAASRYYRVYGMFVSIGIFQAVQNRWSGSRYISVREIGGSRSQDSVHYVDWMLYRSCAHLVGRTNAALDSNTRATVVIASAPYHHWDDKHSLGESTPENTVETTIDLLKQYLRGESSALSTAVLEALVQSTVHYFVGRRPREGQHTGPSGVLTVLLSHVFFVSYNTSSDTPRVVAITLAAAAFAIRTYPGGEKPSVEIGARQKRAVEVFKYYYMQKSMDMNEILVLFLFGFSGLLPLIDFSDKDTQTPIPSSFSQVIRYISRLDLSQCVEICTFPRGDYLNMTLLPPAIESLSSFVKSASPDHEASVVYKCLPFLIHRASWHTNSKVDLYLLAITALCDAKSVELQELCLHVIDAHPIPEDPLHLLIQSDDNRNVFQQLCRTLIECNTTVAPIAALHFELLVAKIITHAASHGWNFSDSQAIFRPLLSLRNSFTSLEEPKQLSAETLLVRLRRCCSENTLTGDHILHIMQSVVDCCEAGVNQNSSDRTYESNNKTLKTLKEKLKPSSDKVVRQSTSELENLSAAPSQARQMNRG
ncbi:hypothetical protein FRC12_012884 [Ceratobasidium sp. 428]|nr:hypothetical protein FRC12_012884 [Ceratobasidium sp. 428]